MTTNGIKLNLIGGCSYLYLYSVPVCMGRDQGCAEQTTAVVQAAQTVHDSMQNTFVSKDKSDIQ